MQTTLEEVAKHRVRLRIDVSAQEAKPTMDLAYRHVAGSVNIPGFRKGKVPRKVVDAQVGRGAVLKEFLQHALEEFYVKALREHELAPIADPEFDDVDIGDVENGGFRFSATVDVRPRLEFQESDYKGVRVERPRAEVYEREVDEQLDRLRERFTELEVVGHPARRGDYVMADIRAYIHEQEVPEASGQDILYEVGSQALVPELDTELEGKRKGDILKFNATLPDQFGDHAGKEVAFQILVKEVKAKKLPPLDDDFAKTSSEFDSLDELREDIRTKLGGLKEAAVDAAIRDRALQALTAKVDAEVPDRLVDRETESRVRRATERAERQGTTLEAVLQASDVDELQFRSDARSHAIRAIKADLALEAVARAEEIQVTKEDVDRVIGELAKELGRDAKQVRRSLESTGQITSLASDIIRGRALDLVVEHADLVDEPGRATESEPAMESEGTGE
ncbi:MAG TPA: trigger factor [Actinomycetota bacterium]|nr:trigger factor [Actinomycetota bacterium]